MPDDNHNMIKPVESLQNIISLTPTRRREERKRRQNLHKQNKEDSQREPNDQIGEEDASSEPGQDENNQHSIDYRAWLHILPA